MMQNKQKAKQLKKQKNHSQEPATELTFLEHFYELRKRLFWVVLTLVVTSALGFQYKDQLISAVMAPLHGQKLIYLTPAGGFSFIFTLSIYFGALLTIPVVIYNIYRFLQPLLGKSSRRLVAGMITMSILLAAAGAAFGYFVTIPGAINFLSEFAGDAVIPSLTAESYLNFVVAYVLGLAVLFQLPLLLFLFDHVRPIPPGMLSSTQRFVIIAATIIAAVITPTPDALNMMVVAIPIILVYEVGVFVVFVRRYTRRPAKQAVQVKASTEQLAPANDLIINSAVPIAQNEMLTQVIENTVAPAVMSQAPSQPKRAIDGMLVTRRPMSTVQLPSRPVTPSITGERAALVNRPVRTIDGFFRSAASQSS